MRTEKLKEQLEEMWKVKSKVVLVLIGALGAVTVMLEVWLQQIPGITSEIAVQKSVVLDPQTLRPLCVFLKLGPSTKPPHPGGEREIFIFLSVYMY